MILLAYDPICQGTWAQIEEVQKTVFVKDKDDQRAMDVINGLCKVGKKLSDIEERFNEDGIEIMLKVETWQLSVHYSSQAHKDLLKIADKVYS